MRTLKSTRKKLNRITRRDSLDSVVKLSALTENYSGGNSVRVSTTGSGQQSALIPSALSIRSSLKKGAPVTIRTRRGSSEVVGWSQANPIFVFENLTTSQNFGDGTITQISFGTDSTFIDEISLQAEDSDVFIIPTGWDGLWRFLGQFTWDGLAGGYRFLWLYLNGVIVRGHEDPPLTGIGSDWHQSVELIKYLKAGDEIKFYGRQGSGSTLQIIEKNVFAEFIRG